LMDAGEHRLALACFYKSLDLEPTHEKARDRFVRCLDEWIALGGPSAEEKEILSEEGEAEIHDERDAEGDWSEEEVITVKEEEDEAPKRPSMAAQEIRKKKEVEGTFLDEDLFAENGGDGPSDEEAGPEEDWTEEGEVWEENGGNEEEEGPPTPRKVVPCKCGHQIPIFTDDRPVRFECPSCGRTGTLKG
jgi:hypothetical protein